MPDTSLKELHEIWCSRGIGWRDGGGGAVGMGVGGVEMGVCWRNGPETVLNINAKT